MQVAGTQPSAVTWPGRSRSCGLPRLPSAGPVAAGAVLVPLVAGPCPVQCASPVDRIDRVSRETARAEHPRMLTAASDDDEGVTFGDDVKSPRVHVRAG